MTTTPDYNTATTERAAALDMLIGFAEGVANSDSLLDMLGAIRLVELAAQQARRAVVAEARAQGASWQELGDALGITRQAAWERFN